MSVLNGRREVIYRGAHTVIFDYFEYFSRYQKFPKKLNNCTQESLPSPWLINFEYTSSTFNSVWMEVLASCKKSSLRKDRIWGVDPSKRREKWFGQDVCVGVCLSVRLSVSLSGRSFFVELSQA